MTAMAPCDTQRQCVFELDGLTLAGQYWGDENAPLVVAVHGWLDNSESFAPIAPAMVAGGYQLLALDWTGHGYSGHRGQAASYTFLEYLYELHQVLLQLPKKPVCLMGHSMGGILAGLYLGTYPEQCDSLVVIEALGPLTQPVDQTTAQIRRGIDSRLRARSPSTDLDVDDLVQARKKLTDLPEALLRPLIVRNLQQLDGKWRWRSDPRLRLRSLIMMNDQQAQQVTESITAPTLILLGEDGFEALQQAWPLRAKWFSNSHMAMVPGGHHCHMTDVAESAQQIIKFLDAKQ
ncbi:alpha/beta fold hydrolase [Ferrimonas lipolytica]|uniref:Alpha/beta hydrolase n=1 Tax=Ferrimonas lipolytica TaxID=2724191 RepID=A0A6H1UCE0_9GAMM|nr:alpha/beta hydrolase [Ferrimonas lipolytica]QIZ76745.1 alpha/beta hydrolase [Ferrimonas lipolytica]